jgi:hypothetical protein
MNADPAEIVIRLDPGATPISGEVRADGDTPRPFTGWAGLFAVLRAAASEQDGARRIGGGTRC